MTKDEQGIPLEELKEMRDSCGTIDQFRSESQRKLLKALDEIERLQKIVDGKDDLLETANNNLANVHLQLNDLRSGTMKP